MKNSTSANSESSPAPASQDSGLSLWQQLKSKRISYLTLPLLVMATVVEFVILATGWKYQQAACLPQGMGVTFFGIGPIGATILAVELLKLPLAIWTASRSGWQKGFMILAGLPLICVLTFQLVKDMAVYEMGAAMKPASELLQKAAAEETKIAQLNGELTAIDGKKTERERKLAEFAAKKSKSKADLEEELKRTDEARKDAISLTDYQTKELSTVEARQSAITRQFDIDAAQISKAIADLRVSRETEMARASKWNAEEARIENAYKAKLAAYSNKKSAYEKDRADYESANILKRQVMREPVDPGVPPEREANTILKPTLVADLDAQIKAKEAELIEVNNKRRDSVGQVASDARRLREDFDRRSSTKREESDHKREALLAAQATLNSQLAGEEKDLDQALGVAVQKVDGIRGEVDAARKKAEGFYEAREAAIRNTQVHRIATTVEIVRGLLFGERPMSITASAKERGDILTDQISMVRIWVYPLLAFIVAFLPTLMVEVGFSTLFKPEQQRPAHRLGFFGRGLHQLYIRAGRQKILRAERLTKEVAAKISTRDQVLAAVQTGAEQALAAKEVELQAAREASGAAANIYEQELKQKEGEWVAKFSDLADSLNRAVIEKDALRDLQKSEIERQIQMRQNAWSDRLTQLRQELDDQRAASELERTTMMQEHHQKLMAVSEDCKTQVIQARRQMTEAELAAVEKSAKLAHDLKEALHARDTAEAQSKHQADSLSTQLSQAQEDAAREMEKAARQAKHRAERQQLEVEKTLREQAEDFEHRLQLREQELSRASDARLAEEKTKVEQGSRRRETELERQLEAQAQEVDAHWNRELQQREEAAQTRFNQREQQWQAQAEAHVSEIQAQAERELRQRELEFDRQLDTKKREADTRLREELQRQELALHAKLKQREQELTNRATVRESELQNEWTADLRVRQEEWERQADLRVRATETRFSQEAQQQVEVVQAKANHREQELVAQLTAQAESHQMAAQEWDMKLQMTRATIPPLKSALARAEKERDEARQSASENASQVQSLEKKLTEASSFLAGWKNTKDVGAARVDRDDLHGALEIAREGSGATGER